MLESLLFIALSFAFGAILSLVIQRNFVSADSQVKRMRTLRKNQEQEIKQLYDEIKLSVDDLRNKFNSIQYQITEFYLQLENTENNFQETFTSSKILTNALKSAKKTKTPLKSDILLENSAPDSIDIAATIIDQSAAPEENSSPTNMHSSEHSNKNFKQQHEPSQESYQISQMVSFKSNVTESEQEVDIQSEQETFEEELEMGKIASGNSRFSAIASPTIHNQSAKAQRKSNTKKSLKL